MPKKDKDYKIHIISNTHWDREWRFSFEETRLRLAEMLDKLLEIFKNDPEFKHYHFDSQTIAIEDYLEIRPEKLNEIKEAVKAGKLQIGPWYSLPDEFMVSGESLVRNLVMGHKVANELGGVMKVGYNPFSFCGQNSQIAQIYNGFDIDTIIFYRGIGTEGNGKDFYLEAPDGSRVLNIRLTQRTRSNFLYFVGRAMYFGRTPERRNRYEIHEEGRICRFAEDELEKRDFDMIKANFSWHEELLKERFEDCFEQMKPPATTRHLIGMDGYDSASPSEFTSKIIKLVKEKLGYDIVHDSLLNTVTEIKNEVPKNLPVIKKEMRFKGNTPIGAISARYYLKQQNRNSEISLQRIAEPLSVLAMKNSKFQYPTESLLMAWKTLLGNQCHDSIGGCASDKVHRTMVERFCKTMEISKGVAKRALIGVVANLDSREIPKNHMGLCVFNTLTQKRKEVIEAYVLAPKEIKLKKPALFNARQERVPAVIEKLKDWTANVEKLGMDYHALTECDTWKVKFQSNIPALGWQTFYLKNDEKSENTKKITAAKINILENKFLKAKINSNGTIDLTDKASGRTMKGLHYFEDNGERGGPWHSGVVPKDRLLNSKKCQAKIKVLEDNELVSSREISLKFRLPADVTPDEQARTSKMLDLPIKTNVILKKDSPMLEFETNIDNTVKSHRLRVLFPSGITKAKTAEAEGQFDVPSRPIIPIDKNDLNLNGGDFLDGTKHSPVCTHPQLSFMDISDGKTGLSVINSGICEYEVKDDKNRTIALTFLRTFPKLKIMHTFLEAKDAQCLGEGIFRYALMPHKGNWEKADLHFHASCFNVPLKNMQFLSDEKNGSLRLTNSFIETEGVITDCIKKAERNNNLVIRVHNPFKTKKDFQITCAKKIKSAYLCNLNEERREELKPEGNLLKGIIPAGKIFTLELNI